MATTETRSGFRLPWTGGDDAHHDDQLTTSGPKTVEATTVPVDEPASVPATNQEADAAIEPVAEVEATTNVDEPIGAAVPAPEASPAPSPAPAPSAPAPSTPPATEHARPNEFLAGLTRAMRTAAEAEREQILARFEDEARTFSSAIRDRSADQADELRTRADDDIEGIHAWSERELARIREETERRIERRRARLDEELEGNAAAADREVERVEASVSAFGERMERFFDGLLAEEDPARFAALAANLPMPPALDADAAADEPPTTSASAEPTATAAPPVTDPVWAGTAGSDPDPVAAPPAASDDPWRDMPMSAPQVSDDEAAAPAEVAEASTPAAATESAEVTEAPSALDPRVAALGLTPDFAAAEAEAAADADADHDEADDTVPVQSEEDVAQRLASLTGSSDPASGTTTRLVVVGLVSVASIAGFKRQLGRVPGVSKVGVSSGPEGEFVFSVTHAEGLDLRDPVTTLPGFGARVVATDDGTLRVECHDPETSG